MAWYAAASVLLLLFSYTQVDLNLTLSRSGLVRTVQTMFQYVGFWQRPWAALWFVATVLTLFAAYRYALIGAWNNRISVRQVTITSAVVACILFFSYPAAFSYDFFNYLFTAKTVLVYRQNPYAVVPLLFAGIDPWTNFMRWTHLPSAYTPFWILLSLVPFAAGLGIFLPVLFATKALVLLFYLGSVLMLARILTERAPGRAAFGLAVFALNPLILTESLVSGHNDIVLVFFALVSVWYYGNRHPYRAWLFLALSVAAKFVTIALIPVYLLRKGIRPMLFSMLTILLAVLTRREFLPWYWVWIMPFAALLPEDRKFIRSAVVVSSGLLLSYAPYIWFGNYSAEMQGWKTGIIWSGVVVALAAYLLPEKPSRPPVI